ncbi:MAG TPA: hypothetical protein VLR92_08190 [Blastocatellia bacterium]|nr:hypothetical protein [Blastocatellia bacterium]
MPKRFMVATLLLSFSSQSSRAQTQDDWDWVNKHFFTVLEEILPIRERLGFSVGYRSYRDLFTKETEFSFVFNRIVQEKYITVIVRQPQTTSLYDQIMTAHRRNPNESIDAIKKQLKLRQQRYSEKTCSAIRIQYDEFYQLTLQMLSAKGKREQSKGEFSIILHPRVHTFTADISGGRMELVLDEPDHPFVIWANKTRELLERCRPVESNTIKTN